MRSCGALVLFLCAACGTEPSVPAPDAIQLARTKFPRFTDLHQQVIARTCSPNRGVCHNSGNYPDLSTAANVLHLLGAPCNLEIPDPLQGWDDCERSPDQLIAGDFKSDVAWSERVERGVRRYGLREAPTVTATRTAAFPDSFDLSLGPDRYNAWTEVALNAGSNEAVVSVQSVALLSDYRARYDSALAAVVPGDPNRNQIYGAELGEKNHAAIITPGSLEASYLWRRITGTVPGSRMPLANQPLSTDEYLAIGCFLEGLIDPLHGAPDATIDYDACAAADILSSISMNSATF